MKKLPASWTKSSPKQLSFAATLFDNPTKEDILYENLLLTLKNAKFFRYLVDHSSLPKKERINAYADWSNILEMGASILCGISRYTLRYAHVTEEDILKDVFVNKIDWAVAESKTRGELLQHHDNVSSKISGMLLAHKPLLKRHSRECKVILQHLEASRINLHRL